MKKVTKFLSDDGTCYDTEEETKHADLVYELTQRLNESDIYWRQDVSTDEVAQFIFANYEVIKRK